MKVPTWNSIFVLVALLPAASGRADDSFAAVIQRMQTNEAVQIAYRETRKLELMDQPWHGSGYLYSLPPDLMIQEQLQPEPLLMAIKGEQMFYFDPGNQIRHQGEMSDEDPSSLYIGVFMALMNGDEARLRHLYRIDFKNTRTGWSIALGPHQELSSGFRITIRGPAEQSANRIAIEQPDGEQREFLLLAGGHGSEVELKMTNLYRQLLGE
ncbi:MAG: LolA family protein [Gammaproteobacteria bacterium]